MLESIRALYRLFNPMLGVLLGITLYPLASLLRLCRYTITLSLLSGVTVPLLLYITVINSMPFLENLDNRVANFIKVSVYLFIICPFSVCFGFSLPFIVPLVAILEGTRRLFTSLYQGVKVGWTEGAFSVLSNVFDSVIETLSNQRLLEWRLSQALFVTQRRAVNNQAAELPFTNAQYTAMLARLDTLLPQLTRSLTEDQFKALELSSLEFGLMCSSRQAPLTESELIRFESDASEILAIKNKITQDRSLTSMEWKKFARSEAVKAYKNLQRLSTDDCAISLNRPLREDTILLTKQYKKGDQWLPVPGMTYVFDRRMLKRSLITDSRHPINREKILLPPPYKKNEISTIDGESSNQDLLSVCEVRYQTRYVFHNYYVTEEGEPGDGVCQEINLLINELRGLLSPTLTSAPAHDDMPIEPTLGHVGP